MKNEIDNQSAPKGDSSFLHNVKRVHPYQRRRTSITGMVLLLQKIIETERLVGVVTARLVGILLYTDGTLSWIR